jgi:hypothetical protein
MRGVTYQIHGVRLRVESDDGPALRSLRRLLEGFPEVEAGIEAEAGWAGCRARVASPEVADACLSLRFAPRALPPPAGARPLFREGSVRALGDGGRLWLTDGWSHLCVDAVTGRAEGEVNPASWTREQEFEESFLRLGLLELLRGQGRFHLRAAALAAGSDVLLAAGDLAGDPPSLAEACVGLKGQVLASGPVLLQSGPDGVAVGEWPALFGRQAEVQPAELRFLAYIRAAPEECRPTLLLFPIERPGPTWIEPLLAREALAALVPASPLLFSTPSLATAHLETLRALVRQCRCYRLLHSPDLRRRPEAAADLLHALSTEPQELVCMS